MLIGDFSFSIPTLSPTLSFLSLSADSAKAGRHCPFASCAGTPYVITLNAFDDCGEPVPLDPLNLPPLSVALCPGAERGNCTAETVRPSVDAAHANRLALSFVHTTVSLETLFTHLTAFRPGST